jgi:4,5-DOPA dioxygenase extradiol
MAATRSMPVLFVGHGSPMNAIEDNTWSRAFRALGDALPEPRAILAISAHWFVAGTWLTANERPPTIHDFGGFPRELYEIQYPAAGDIGLARRVAVLLADWQAGLSEEWGLDHGTWSVLRHLRPAADVPLVQLSLDARLPPAAHLAIGRALAPLRAEGVLIMGSGNVVHNLSDAFARMRRDDSSTPDWATAFDADVARALERHDHEFLARAAESEVGRKAHPTPDHYLPLLHAAGASDAADTVRFPILGFDMGSLSMRTVLWR